MPSGTKLVTRTELIERPNRVCRPHVMLLGAGASVAAFPNGDKSSNPIPLMNNLVATLNLHSLLERVGELNDVNFESVYSKLAANPRYEEIRGEVETRVTIARPLRCPRKLRSTTNFFCLSGRAMRCASCILGMTRRQLALAGQRWCAMLIVPANQARGGFKNHETKTNFLPT